MKIKRYKEHGDRNEVFLEDDAKEPMSLMLEHRVPWLAIGLIGGITATLLSAHYEEVLSKNIHLAFFIPVIVYMADAMGTQTENVYVRNLSKKKPHIAIYFLKEFILGITLGSVFGVCAGIFAQIWFNNVTTSITVGLAMSITMGIAPIIALIVPTVMWKTNEDPAVGAGPFTTVVQDLLSLFIYFFIATAIILH